MAKKSVPRKNNDFLLLLIVTAAVTFITASVMVTNELANKRSTISNKRSTISDSNQTQNQVQVQVQAVAPSPLSSFWTHQNDHTVVEHGGGVSVPGLPDVWMTPGHCFWLIGYLDHSTSFEGRDS
jgi:Flp pilus assembly protein TadB